MALVVDEVYMTPYYSSSWGANLLYGDYIPNGFTMDFDIEPGLYDIMLLGEMFYSEPDDAWAYYYLQVFDVEFYEDDVFRIYFHQYSGSYSVRSAKLQKVLASDKDALFLRK